MSRYTIRVRDPEINKMFYQKSDMNNILLYGENVIGISGDGYGNCRNIKSKDVKIMQNIPGLYDKNGKQIREGDILDFDEKERGGEFRTEVIWLNEIIGERGFRGDKSDVAQWRAVIGNVFENPELLSE